MAGADYFRSVFPGRQPLVPEEQAEECQKPKKSPCPLPSGACRTRATGCPATQGTPGKQHPENSPRSAPVPTQPVRRVPRRISFCRLYNKERGRSLHGSSLPGNVPERIRNPYFSDSCAPAPRSRPQGVRSDRNHSLRGHAPRRGTRQDRARRLRARLRPPRTKRC